MTVRGVRLLCSDIPAPRLNEDWPIQSIERLAHTSYEHGTACMSMTVMTLGMSQILIIFNDMLPYTV